MVMNPVLGLDPVWASGVLGEVPGVVSESELPLAVLDCGSSTVVRSWVSLVASLLLEVLVVVVGSSVLFRAIAPLTPPPTSTMAAMKSP